MAIKMTDVTIHINEETTMEDREALRDQLLSQNGVMTADYRNNRSHLFIVEYDPDVVNSMEFLKIVERCHMHGQLIGM